MRQACTTDCSGLCEIHVDPLIHARQPRRECGRAAAAYRAVKMLPAARVLLAAIVVLAAEVAPSSKLALNRGYAACTLPPADVLRRRSLAAAAPAVSASGAACPPPPASGSSCTELESVVTSSYYPGDPARTAVSCWIYDEDVKAKRCSLDLDSGPAGGGGVTKCCCGCLAGLAGWLGGREEADCARSER